jgi:hypothetical protein
MSKYGFDEEEQVADPAKAIQLPKPKAKVTDRPAPAEVREAIKAGEKLGFVSREPIESRQSRKPGRRKALEPQDQLLISGPQRILEAFRDYCDAHKISSYWAGLEKLLEKSAAQ